MNEQIQQMIFSLNGTVGIHWTHEDKIKFAQLIARECAALVQGVPTDTMGYHTADQKIKEHFGVSE
jgi:hypothetical protein